jgi:predicted transcriptional regulator
MSSFRISKELRAQLEAAADHLKCGKSAIITHALREYLHRINQQRFLEEARRQSILASAAASEDEDAWLEAH